MKYPDNIVQVGALLPDYMGFIFWEKSARYCNENVPELIKTIKKVGVFVNQSQEEIFVGQINQFVPKGAFQNFLKIMMGFFTNEIPDHISLENQQEIYVLLQKNLFQMEE